MSAGDGAVFGGRGQAGASPRGCRPSRLYGDREPDNTPFHAEEFASMKTSSPWKSRGSVNDTHGGVHRSYSLSPAFPSFRQQENVGAEDQQANDHGSDRRDQHGSRRDILGVFNQRVKIR